MPQVLVVTGVTTMAAIGRPIGSVRSHGDLRNSLGRNAVAQPVGDQANFSSESVDIDRFLIIVTTTHPPPQGGTIGLRDESLYGTDR